MKILLVSNNKFVNCAGGAEKVLCNMANHFAIKGDNVSILVFDKEKGKPFFELNESVKIYNPYFKINHLISTIKGAFIINKGKRQKMRDDYEAELIKPAFINVIKEIKPDIIIVYNLRAMNVISKIEDLKIPVIFMFHQNAESILSSGRCIEAIEKCDCVQVLMPADINLVKNIFPHKRVVCIPNTVKQASKCISGGDKRPLIINVNRIDRSKAIEILINAFADIKEEYKKWNVEIYGNTDKINDYQQELMQLIEERRLSEQIRFMGTSDSIEEKLLSAEIFAFPSSREGFGLALTEAMAAGLPCVGMRYAPAVNEIIIDGYNGFLCDDSKEFAEKLACLIDNEALRRQMGVNARESIKKYAPEVVWQQWEELINSCIFKRRT